MIELISSIVAGTIEVQRSFFADHADDMIRATTMIGAVFSTGRKAMWCGNGGSSTDAQHIAGEFVNRFAVRNRRALPSFALWDACWI